MTKNKAIFGRICIIVAIFIVSALIIGIMVKLSSIKNDVFEGADKITKACDLGEKKNFCKKISVDHFKKYVNIGYIGIMVLLGLFILVSLLGLFGSIFANRCLLITFIVFVSIFFVLFLVPMGGGALGTHITSNIDKDLKDEHDLGKIRTFVNNTLFNNIKKFYDLVKEHKDNFKVGPFSLGQLTLDQRQYLMRTYGKDLKIVHIKKTGPESNPTFDPVWIENIQGAIDWIQQYFECCGVIAYHEWQLISVKKAIPELQGINVSGLFYFERKDESRILSWDQECFFDTRGSYSCYVPKSCCKRRNAHKCNEGKHGKTDIVTDIKDINQIFNKPCFDNLVYTIRNAAVALLVLFLALEILILVACCSACCI